MPPPITAAVRTSENNSDEDEELRAMEQQQEQQQPIIAPKPQRPARAGNQPVDAARPGAAHAAASSTVTQARTVVAPAAGTTRPAAASGDAPRKAATPPARPASAHATYRPIRVLVGSSSRPGTPANAKTAQASAVTKKKTPTTATKPAAPSSVEKTDYVNVGEILTTSRVVATEHQTTPRIPATYAEKIKRITTHKLAAKIESRDPRMIKQRSLESIHRSTPSTSGMLDTQRISFDRSARTVSPSNVKPISPTPFPSRFSHDDLTAAAYNTQQRETRKRQLEADDTTATQPAKMQPPALITTPPTPPIPQESQQPPQVAAFNAGDLCRANIDALSAPHTCLIRLPDAL
ncbi:hypothetical protein ACJJTC_012514 [Scirpophaga incertulas]